MKPFGKESVANEIFLVNGPESRVFGQWGHMQTICLKGLLEDFRAGNVRDRLESNPDFFNNRPHKKEGQANQRGNAIGISM